MKTQPTHTPTPWKTMPLNPFIFSGDEPEELAVCRTDIKLPPERNDANAAYIVRAVNAHEELIATLKEVSKHATDLNKNDPWIMERIYKAISRAEGK